jgi:hypothetical protein
MKNKLKPDYQIRRIAMKKTVMMMMTAAALAAVSAPMNASAAETVNVTFSLETIDQNTLGERTVTGSVEVKDTDSDGKLTPADVMYLAHEKYYPGGAAAGLDETYTWGVASLYTCNITDKNGTCVYTSSGPVNTRYTLEDGDSISWTAQYFMQGDYTNITLSGLTDSANSKTVTNAPISVHIDVKPQLKQNVGKLSAAGMKIFVDDTDTGVVTDQNGNAAISVKTAGTHYINVYRANNELAVRQEVVVNENESAPAATTAPALTTVAAQSTTTAQNTTSAPAVTTESVAQTTTTALTTTAQSSAQTTTTTAAATAASTTKATTTAAKSGNVKTGDNTPIAALLFAGLTAAGLAFFTMKRRVF